MSWPGVIASAMLHTSLISTLLIFPPREVQEEPAEVYSVALLPGLSASEPVKKPLPTPVEPPPPAPTEEPLPVREKEPELPAPVAEQNSNPAQPPQQEEANAGAQPSLESEATAGESNYWQLVRSAVAGKTRYPSSARQRKQEGYALVRLTIDAEGHLQKVIPLEASADIFSKSATEAVERAAPFPPPTNCVASELTAVIPIHFSLKRALYCNSP